MNKVLLSFTVLSITLIILSINRGFDISDEGVYALLAVPSQENLAGMFNYDLFFKFLYKFTGIEFGLIGLRILRLLSCLVAAFSLTIFWRNLNYSVKKNTSDFFISLLGILGSYGFLSQTLSYNSINLMCGCLWLGLISLYRQTNRSILFLGTTLTLLFYSKITVCWILGILTFSIILLNSDRKVLIKRILMLCLPFLLVELVFFFTLGESGVLRAFAAQKMLDFRPDYHFMTIFKYSFVGVFWSVVVIFPFVIAGYLKTIRSNYFRSVLGIGMIIFIVIAYFTTITNEINHVLLLGTLAVLGFLMGASGFSKMSQRETIFLFLLIVFPFILHFGSNVYFLRIGIHYWVFWILAIRFILGKKKIEEKVIFCLYLPVLSLLLLVNGLSLYAFNDYSYFKETVPFEYRNGKSIKLPIEQVRIYNKLKEEINSSCVNEILPVYRNPGLVYIIGKEHPKTIGIWSRQQLDYFFPDPKDISVILYNDSFEFPFEKKNWIQGSSFKFSNGEFVTVFWKK